AAARARAAVAPPRADERAPRPDDRTLRPRGAAGSGRAAAARAAANGGVMGGPRARVVLLSGVQDGSVVGRVDRDARGASPARPCGARRAHDDPSYVADGTRAGLGSARTQRRVARPRAPA